MKKSIVVSLLLLGSMAHGADRPAPPSSVPLDRSCDRACLYRSLDGFLEALRQRDPWRATWAKDALYSENNVAMPLGEGLWGTLTRLESYDLRLADPSNGQVAMFGAVNERGAVSPFVVRLEIRDGAIRRAEMLVRRKATEPRMMADPKFEKKPVFDEVIPAQDRLPRARLISIADGYFDTLQLNDGTLFTKFHANCKRVENGVQTTNNPNFAVVPVSRLGCEEQFKAGNYRYDTRLRARRFMLLDEERGLVLAAGFIDHAGVPHEYQLTDGTKVRSPVHRPHSFYLFELFKLKDGAIEQIEANFITVPYNMPSPWDDWAHGDSASN